MATSARTGTNGRAGRPQPRSRTAEKPAGRSRANGKAAGTNGRGKANGSTESAALKATAGQTAKKAKVQTKQSRKAPVGSKAALSGEERKRLRQAELLLHVSRKVAAIESLDEILRTLVELTTWEVDAERGVPLPQRQTNRRTLFPRGAGQFSA